MNTSTKRRSNPNAIANRSAKAFLAPVSKKIDKWVSRSVYLQAVLGSGRASSEEIVRARHEISSISGEVEAERAQLVLDGAEHNATTVMSSVLDAMDHLSRRLALS